MRIFIVATILFMSASAVASEEHLVEECTFSSMRGLAIDGLKNEVISVLKEKAFSPIEVAKEDISLIDRGILGFADHDFLGVRQEQAFSVSFKTKNGTPMLALSAVDDPLCKGDALIYQGVVGVECYNRPLHNVVSIPEPKVRVDYDSQGNERARYCDLRLYDHHNRSVLYVNSNTGVVVEASFTSLRNPVATARIQSVK